MNINRCLTIISFFISILYLGTAAKCTSINNHLPSYHLINRPHISHAFSISGREENDTPFELQFLLFRKGVDGKSILFSHSIYQNSSYYHKYIPDNFSINSRRVKYILSFFKFLALPPEFLSSFSLHSPPVFC